MKNGANQTGGRVTLPATVEIIITNEKGQTMKRDMDLVRAILLEVEQAEYSLDITRFYHLHENKNVVEYHLSLLVEQGFLDGTLHGVWGKKVAAGCIDGLTWDGQDFLDAIRDAGMWAKVKKVISETVGTTTFDVVKATCSMVATTLIKEQLNLK